MSVKALKRQLIAAIAMVLVATIALGSSTYAWFAANQRVTATGMKVNATTSSSLVIANALNVGTATTVAMSTNSKNLIPATHDSTVGTTTGLKYNTNPQVVSAQTGYASGSTALTFAEAANDTDHDYYIDYVVYVASAGSAMENTGLKAYLYTDAAISADTTKATSVDFYVNEDATTLGTYKGTLNLSTLTASANADGATYYTADLTLLADTGTIPQNNSASDYIQITMRVYYDGALEKSSGQAYVYSDVVTTEGIAFNVSFNAVPKTA